MECNAVLRSAPKSEVLARLPEDTEKYYERFAACIACDKIYWEGSHHRRMRELVDELLAQSGEQISALGREGRR